MSLDRDMVYMKVVEFHAIYKFLVTELLFDVIWSAKYIRSANYVLHVLWNMK